MFDTENRVPLGNTDSTFSRIVGALVPLFQAIGALPKGRYAEALAWGTLFVGYVVHLRGGPARTRRSGPPVVAVIIVMGVALVLILTERFVAATAVAVVGIAISLVTGVMERRRLHA